MSNKASSSRSARLLNPAPQELRDLVLDFIVHNCYTNAARAFVRESDPKHVDADGDELMHSPEKETPADLGDLEERLVMGELRKEIRTCILTGRIDEATALLNKHFPAVLSEDTVDTSSSSKLEYLPSTSVNPAHLALNLRIQAFVEAARTKPLLYYPPGSKTPLTHPPLLSTIRQSNTDDEDADMSEDDLEAASAELLHRAQGLYSQANQLTSPDDRAQYLAELGHVGGLLAYKVPERSPLVIYMTQQRREAVADQIDSAILYRAKRPVVSRIELYTRYTSTVWGMMHEQKVKVPSRSTWPAGASLPPTTSQSEDAQPAASKDSGSLENVIPSTKKATAEKDTDEIIPPFDLHLFVESQERR